MTSLESCSKICALCTKFTTFPILEGGEEKDCGDEVLQKFIHDFSLLSSHTTTTVADSWSLCHRCLPDVQSALQSTEKVNKVECQVRRLQVQILKMLQNLVVETRRMYEDLRKIQQIVGRRPAVKGQIGSLSVVEDKELIRIFKERISYVVRDLEDFSISTLNKVLNTVEPSVKIEPQFEVNIDEGEDQFGQDNWSSLGMSHEEPRISLKRSPPVSEDGILNHQRKSMRIKRKLKAKPVNKIIKKTSKPEVNKTMPSSDEDNEDQEQDPFSDEDFDPQDDNFKISTGGKLSVFRRRLIKRIREARTISTSKNLPSSDSDPRRPYSIKYNSSTKKFFIENFEFIVIDSLKQLKCVTCNFTIDSLKMAVKTLHVEDIIFDHILGKHLKLYNCLKCDSHFDLFAYLTDHNRRLHPKQGDKSMRKFIYYL